MSNSWEYDEKWGHHERDGKNPELLDYIDRGDHLIDRNWTGQTPLHIAARFDNPEIVTKLLNSGVAVNIRNSSYNRTPLHRASLSSSKILIKYGADINAVDILGETPLHWSWSEPEKVTVLLEAGADFALKNTEGKSAKENFEYYLDSYRKNNVEVDLNATVVKSIALLDAISKPLAEYNRCEKKTRLVSKRDCFSRYAKNYAGAKKGKLAKDQAAYLNNKITKEKKVNSDRIAKIARAKKAKQQSYQKRLAKQACKVNSNDWIYLSKSCKNGLANGRGEAVNDEKNLKFVGQFILGDRTQGELYVNEQLMYDGPIKNGRPHGTGTCIYQNEPEECKYYKGKRTDVLYKQRIEFIKQRELMAQSEKRINKSLKDSEQRMNESLSKMEAQQIINRSAGSRSAEGKGLGDYAASALKKKAADEAADFIFDQLF